MALEGEFTRHRRKGGGGGAWQLGTASSKKNSDGCAQPSLNWRLQQRVGGGEERRMDGDGVRSSSANQSSIVFQFHPSENILERRCKRRTNSNQSPAGYSTLLHDPPERKLRAILGKLMDTAVLRKTIGGVVGVLKKVRAG